MKRPILCLDFDGVIHSYTSGWKGADVIPDPPVDGAMAFIAQAVDSFDVAIFSSRSHQPGGRGAMHSYILTHMLSYLEANADGDEGQARALAHRVVGSLLFPLDKPPAMVTIDDRAITFTGTWPAVDELLAFKPWNKK